MKRFFKVCILAYLALSLTSCLQAPERNCELHKTGSYQSIAVVNGDTLITTFVRNELLEIESFQGKQDTSTVRWINDCEYVLKKQNPQNKAEEKSILIKILTTTDSSYTFEFNAVGTAKKLRATAYKQH